MNLHECSDEELLTSIATLLGSRRQLTAKLVAHLAEIENRRLHLVSGFSSMFDFCQKKLRMSEAEAFRRILAARLGSRFSVVYSLLASGDVNLSTLELLRPYLTDENHGELFTVVTGKGKREVQAYLAGRFPQPDRPSSIQRTTLEPLGSASFRVEFTASEALREKLELCRDLMSHANPSRDLAVVTERGVDLLLEHLERRRLGKVRRPRQAHRLQERTPTRIANATRREVYERDGLRCTYVAEDGRRCEARAFLELDHAEAKALGGSNESHNLRVRCRAHNQLAAELTFGREKLEWSRHFRQKKSTAARAPATPANAIAAGHAPLVNAMAPKPSSHDAAGRESNAITLEKVHRALRSMGFREAQARAAIATVVRMHAPSESLALEQALREALLVATAA